MIARTAISYQLDVETPRWTRLSRWYFTNALSIARINNGFRWGVSTLCALPDTWKDAPAHLPPIIVVAGEDSLLAKDAQSL